MFSVWQIIFSALVSTFSSFAILFIWHRRSRMNLAWEVVVPAVLVGLSVLLWRVVGNLTQLNDDLLPGVSPNDVLCPVVTYTILGCYFGFRGTGDPARWERIRAVLTVIPLLVNVITI
jgi:hypothetical protein